MTILKEKCYSQSQSLYAQSIVNFYGHSATQSYHPWSVPGALSAAWKVYSKEYINCCNYTASMYKYDMHQVVKHIHQCSAEGSRMRSETREIVQRARSNLIYDEKLNV